jgi:hypothetical protein
MIAIDNITLKPDICDDVLPQRNSLEMTSRQIGHPKGHIPVDYLAQQRVSSL